MVVDHVRELLESLGADSEIPKSGKYLVSIVMIRREGTTLAHYVAYVDEVFSRHERDPRLSQDSKIFPVLFAESQRNVDLAKLVASELETQGHLLLGVREGNHSKSPHSPFYLALVGL